MAINPISNRPNLTQVASAETASKTGPAQETPQQARLKKATQEFEAVFIGMMLKQMRKSMTGGNALFGNSHEAKLYQDMMDDATASQMSRTGSFGLARVLYKTLERTLATEEKE